MLECSLLQHSSSPVEITEPNLGNRGLSIALGMPTALAALNKDMVLIKSYASGLL